MRHFFERPIWPCGVCVPFNFNQTLVIAKRNRFWVIHLLIRWLTKKKKWLTHTLSRTNFCAAPTNSFVPLMRLPNFRPTFPTNFFALFRDVWIEKLQEDEGNTKTRLQYKLCSQSPNSRGTFGHTHTHTHTHLGQTMRSTVKKLVGERTH